MHMIENVADINFLIIVWPHFYFVQDLSISAAANAWLCVH